jgi:hypothetical protein
MTDDRDIFDDESPATTTEGVSPEAPETARDDKGRFAAKDTGDAAPAEAAPPAEPVRDAPPASVEPKDHFAPIAAVLDEREKRQRAEAERDEYKRRHQEIERQIAASRQQPPQLPDAVEKPEEFAAFLMQQQRAQLDNLEAQFSERFARREYGTEAVDAALEAARAQNVIGHFTRGPDRWERMCEWHKQQQMAAEIGNDPAAYRTKVEAELREKLRAELMAELKPSLKAQIEAEHAAAAEAAVSSTRPKAPRSLAAAPGSGYAPPTAGGGNPLFD